MSEPGHAVLLALPTVPPGGLPRCCQLPEPTQQRPAKPWQLGTRFRVGMGLDKNLHKRTYLVPEARSERWNGRVDPM